MKEIKHGKRLLVENLSNVKNKSNSLEQTANCTVTLDIRLQQDLKGQKRSIADESLVETCSAKFLMDCSLSLSETNVSGVLTL